MTRLRDGAPTSVLTLAAANSVSPVLELTRWSGAGLCLAAWTVFGVLSASQVYIQERGDASVHGVFHVLLFYWAWAVVTPVIVFVARWARARPTVRLPAGAILVLPAHALVYNLFVGRPFVTGVPDTLIYHGAGNALTYISVVGLLYGAEYYRRAQRAAELELGALRAQLQPHFLFNALNSIATLVVKGDASAATRALARLGDLLRAALSTSTSADATLDRELAFARRYLDIERLRFGNRLTVVERIDDSALRGRLPSFILQPIVENAVRHGRSRVEIEAERLETDLIVRVRDDGPGFGGGPSINGVGLANTRARLALQYGTRARLSTENAEEGGAIVTLVVPFMAT